VENWEVEVNSDGQIIVICTCTGTVLGWNNVASVRPRNIFCYGIWPCGPYCM